jgi:hypothetical protein
MIGSFDRYQPRLPRGSQLTADSLNDILRRLEGTDADLSTLRQTPGQPGFKPHVQLVQIDADASGGGQYTGKVFMPVVTARPTGNLSSTDLGMTQAVSNCIVWNLDELGGSTHDLASGTVTLGIVVGQRDDDNYWIVIIASSAGADRAFPVKIEKDGGSDGTSTAAASWTYTVKNMDETVSLGTAVSVTRPRPNGLMTYQVGTFSGGNAGYGVGFYNDNGTFVLWDAGEVPTTSACT